MSVSLSAPVWWHTEKERVSPQPSQSLLRSAEDARITLSLASSTFSCGICFETLDKNLRVPKLFPCGHYACAEDVRRLASISISTPPSESETYQRSFACHLCRAVVTSPSTLPNHHLLLELMENAAQTNPSKMGSKQSDVAATAAADQSDKAEQTPAAAALVTSAACEECDRSATKGCTTCTPPTVLCDLHAESHQTSKKTKDHRIVAVTSDEFVRAKRNSSASSAVLKCQQHPSDVLEYFCVPCEIPICLRCLAVHHQDHKRMELSDAVRSLQPDITALTNEAERILKRVRNAVQQVIQMKEKIPQNFQTVQTSIQNTFERARAALLARENELLAEANSIQITKLKQISEQLDALQLHEASLDSMILQTKITTNDAFASQYRQINFLTLHQQILKGLQRDLDCVSHLTLSPEVSDDMKFIMNEDLPKQLITSGAVTYPMHASKAMALEKAGKWIEAVLCWSEACDSNEDLTGMTEWRMGKRRMWGYGLQKNTEKAEILWLKSASKGHPGGIAECKRYGLGSFGQSEANSFQLVNELANNSDGDGLVMLGEYYQNGIGVPKDEKKAVEWFNRAAVIGHPQAQYYIGNAYALGIGVSKDSKKAFEWYGCSAEQEHSAAQFKLGESYAVGRGVQKDEKKSNEWYRRAAENGHADGQVSVGRSYLMGSGVDKDDKAAIHWLRKAVDQGNAHGQYMLAWCYERGHGVDKNMQEAAVWYARAAKLGNAEAQFNAGWCYAKGQGVAQDVNQAAEWYIRASEQGHPQAQYQLGRCYSAGRGIGKDEKKAVEMYLRAAGQGISAAQVALGDSYDQGLGVPRDEKLAIEWYNRAADGGNDTALQKLQNIIKRKK